MRFAEMTEVIATYAFCFSGVVFGWWAGGMPRTSRASRGGCVYHVINRGNARIDAFLKEVDNHAIIQLMQDANQRLPMCLTWYRLMPNVLSMPSRRKLSWSVCVAA